MTSRRHPVLPREHQYQNINKPPPPNTPKQQQQQNPKQTYKNQEYCISKSEGHDEGVEQIFLRPQKEVLWESDYY